MVQFSIESLLPVTVSASPPRTLAYPDRSRNFPSIVEQDSLEKTPTEVVLISDSRVTGPSLGA